VEDFSAGSSVSFLFGGRCLNFWRGIVKVVGVGALVNKERGAR